MAPALNFGAQRRPGGRPAALSPRMPKPTGAMSVVDQMHAASQFSWRAMTELTGAV